MALSVGMYSPRDAPRKLLSGRNHDRLHTLSHLLHRTISFDAREATVSSVHQALSSGSASCRDILQAFLARIELHNPTINAIISLNPNALRQADELDDRLARGKGDGRLFGVPILLKDNFNAVGMATTAGSRALKDVWPTKDAPVVSALRRAGAIILGKANLHEFALEGLTVSSLGGQTLNPYDFTRTPGGSSGGSGAAVAASFAVMATGSDTVNSLRSPASANSLYSFRPTQGLISRAGVIPVGSTQDTVGMIGRSLTDIATALTVMVESNSAKAVNDMHIISDDAKGVDYVHGISSDVQTVPRTYRIGVLQAFMDQSDSPEIEPVNRAMQSVQALLESLHIDIIPIVDAEVFDAPKILSTMDVQMWEIRQEMDQYLSGSDLGGNYPSTFADIFSSSRDEHSDFLVLPDQYHYVHTALNASASSPEYVHRKALIADLTRSLQQTFHTHTLDAIIYPQQRNLVVPVGSRGQHGRNGILAAVTGSPALCIPIGFSQPTSTAPIGLPIGMEILGLPWTEAKLFEIAKIIDSRLRARKAPVTGQLADMVNSVPRYESVPRLVPLGLNSVDIQKYPPGVF